MLLNFWKEPFPRFRNLKIMSPYGKIVSLIIKVVTRYLGSGIKGVGSGIRMVGSEIIAVGSGITSHGIAISRFFEPGSRIRLNHFCGTAGANLLSRFRNQGSELWVQKWDQRWKNNTSLRPCDNRQLKIHDERDDDDVYWPRENRNEDVVFGGWNES